jgi:uncharacterized protein
VTAETQPTDPLLLLVEVQDLDTAIARLEHRKATLSERQELEATERALSELAARATDLGNRRQALAARQAELEEQIASVSGRRQALEDRLYAARGSAARDLQAMDDEIHHLAQRRAEIEEVELEVMVEQEPVDAELDQLATERAGLEETASRQRATLTVAASEVDTELSALHSSRVAAASGLPPDLAERYETIRRRLGGVGAARLVGNRCDGCHLELPSAEVDRIRHLPAGTVAHCDQCGRILVRVPPA